MKEAVVEQKVETYFRDRFPQFSVSPQCQVRFGTRTGAFSFKQILGLSKFLDPLFQVRRGCKPRLPGLGGPKSG